MDKKNTVASALQMIGFLVFVCGILLGLEIADSVKELSDEFPTTAVLVMAGSFVTFILFLGFAEVINLLQCSTNNQAVLIQNQAVIINNQGVIVGCLDRNNNALKDAQDAHTHT